MVLLNCSEQRQKQMKQHRITISNTSRNILGKGRKLGQVYSMPEGLLQRGSSFPQFHKYSLHFTPKEWILLIRL